MGLNVNVYGVKHERLWGRKNLKVNVYGESCQNARRNTSPLVNYERLWGNMNACGERGKNGG